MAQPSDSQENFIVFLQTLASALAYIEKLGDLIRFDFVTPSFFSLFVAIDVDFPLLWIIFY